MTSQQRFRPRAGFPLLVLALSAAGFAVPVQSVWAQGGGSYAPSAGGYGSSSSRGPVSWRDSRSLPTETTLNFIAIDGVAERRLMPDQIRVVLAVSSEAAAVGECRQQNTQQIDAVIKKWTDLGFARDKIVTDFIAISPRYAWQNTTRGNEQVLAQKQDGYRMQSNLHIVVANEQEAMNAVEGAIEQGVSEIVTFEYGSSQLNAAKEQVRKAALEAAQKKAALLLTVFEERPPVINVQEKTDVILPQQLYVTYSNELEEELTSYPREKPRIRAYRPKHTFYHGLDVDADDRPTEIPLRPEIVVVSSVRIYYQSPAKASRTNLASGGVAPPAP